MKKSSNKKLKKNTSIGNKFAYGGTALEIESPDEAMARYRKNNILAQQEAMLAGAPYKAISGLLFNTGLNLLGQGIDNAGGFGKILGSNDKLSGFGKGLDNLLGFKTGEAGIGKIDKILPGADVERVIPSISEINSIDNYSLPNSFGGGKGFGKTKVPQWLKGNEHLFTTAPWEVPSFALGGTVPIEAEGGEVIETPGGIPQELVGPSHEGGGMDMLVPPGTDIYSKRVKGPDGRSMAQRKKDRERKEAKLQKLLEKNKGDKTLQKTLAKVQQDNKIEDQQDIEYMRSLQASQMEIPQQEFAFGGTVNSEKEIKPLEIVKKKRNLEAVFAKPMDIVMPTNLLPQDDGTRIPNNTWGIIPENIPNAEESKLGKFWDTLKGVQYPLKGATAGDILGMYANWKASRDQMKNTIDQFRNTPEEKNHWKNYGQEALGTIRDQYGILEGIKDNMLQDLELSRTSTINRNNNGARGINTLRALNLATDAQMNKVNRDIHNNYTSQKLGIIDKEARLQEAIDNRVMQGEETRDKNTLENQDTFFTQMGQNIADKYKGITNIAKVLNDRKEFNLKEGTLLASNPYVKKNADGSYGTDMEKYEAHMKYQQETRDKSGIDTQDYTNFNKVNKDIQFTKDGKVHAKSLEYLNNNNYLWEGVINPRTGKPFTNAEEYAKDQFERSSNPYINKLHPIKYVNEASKFKDPITGQAFTSQKELHDYIKAGGKIEDLEQLQIKYQSNFITNPETKSNLLGKSLDEDELKSLDNVLQKLNFKVDLKDAKSIKELQKKLKMPKKYQTGKIGKITLKYISEYNG